MLNWGLKRRRLRKATLEAEVRRLEVGRDILNEFALCNTAAAIRIRDMVTARLREIKTIEEFLKPYMT
jgi:hypothetical protein